MWYWWYCRGEAGDAGQRPDRDEKKRSYGNARKMTKAKASGDGSVEPVRATKRAHVVAERLRWIPRAITRVTDASTTKHGRPRGPFALEP